MKLVKMSFVAAVVATLATNSFAADTLADAFKNGKIKGEFKATYWDRNDQTTLQGNEQIFNTGLMMGYITDALYNFKLGATFQSTYSPWAEENAKEMFKREQYGSGAVLSEAYLQYNIGKTAIKVGRQFIPVTISPLVAGSGTRFIKESFQGATFLSNDIPDTTLFGAYVNKFQGRTSFISGKAMGDAPSFVRRGVFPGIIGPREFDGFYALGAINKSVKNLTLMGQYAIAKDIVYSPKITEDINFYYVAGNYIIPFDSFKLGLDLVHRGSDADGAMKDLKLSGSLTHGQISILDLSGFNILLAASKSDKSDDLVTGLGVASGFNLAGTMLTGAPPTYVKNTDSYLLDVGYDFSRIGAKGLKGQVQYGKIKQKVADGRPVAVDITMYDLYVTYAVPSVKGLSFGILGELQEKEVGAKKYDINEIRFTTRYNF